MYKSIKLHEINVAKISIFKIIDKLYVLFPRRKTTLFIILFFLTKEGFLFLLLVVFTLHKIYLAFVERKLLETWYCFFECNSILKCLYVNKIKERKKRKKVVVHIYIHKTSIILEYIVFWCS